MAFFTTSNCPNGYQPEVPMPEVKPPKCISAENGIIAADKTSTELLDELYNENAKLRKKLKKVRKEKKRWKRKYFKLYNDAMILKNTVDAFNVLYNPNSSSLEKIESRLRLGLEPISEDIPEGFGLKTVSEGLDLFKKK